MPAFSCPGSHKTLLALTIAVLLITLFFGLRPKGFDFSNHVQWLQERAGIHFEKYSLVYADLDKELIAKKFSRPKGFSIGTAIHPESFNKKKFQIIFSIHDGKDQNQLILGQWNTSLIIMNGDDYKRNKITRRITWKVAPESPKEILLSITSGPQGTSLYIDGNLVQSDPKLTLQLPHAGQPKLTTGNSVFGKHPWKGSVFGLGLYGYELAPATIESHFNNWTNNKNFVSLKKDRPSLLYLFKEQNGTRALDHMNGKSPLIITSNFHLLKKTILSPPLPDSGVTKSFIQDITQNFLGFIPLGFFIAAVFFQLGRPRKQAFILSIFLCFILSLGIEILQSWMPSRSSQSLDVALNTLGAMTGAFIHKRISFS